MPALEINLLKLYIPLVTWVCLGLILGYKLPRSVPLHLGKFLFWVGVPVSIFTFLRQADLSGAVWIAPAASWAAIFMGAFLAWFWIKWQHYLRDLDEDNLRTWLRRWSKSASQTAWSRPTQGSFLLAAMIGNTGYLGYPVTLALVGPQYFAWALFYDTLGSTLGAYGLGVAIAARFGMSAQDHWKLLQAVLSNPGLWSFFIGLGFREVPLPPSLEQGLRVCAWMVIGLSLLLLGMRLSQLTSWRNVQQASVSLSIKMLVVPLAIGLGLPYLGITGPAHLVIVLQMAMPPAFATLVIAEAYDLDRELAVTTLAIGSLGLLAMLPIWIWLFSS